MSVFSFKQASFSYPGKQLFSDLTYEARDALLVRGANGSGKTTLLRVASKLEVLQNGVVSLDGRSSYKASIFFDNRILFNEQSVLTHLNWLKHFLRENDEFINERLEMLAIDSSVRAGALSWGQRDLLALLLMAEIAIHEADIFVADEPFAHLDECASEKFVEFLKRVQEAKKFVLISATKNQEVPFLTNVLEL